MQFSSSIVAWVLAIVLKELIVPLSFNLIASQSWKTDLSFADKTFFFSKIGGYISLKNNCFSLAFFDYNWLQKGNQFCSRPKFLALSGQILSWYEFFFFWCYRLVRVLSFRSLIDYFRPFSIFLLLFAYLHFLFYK